MSDDQFIISDIEDSENDEFTDGFKEVTINTPHLASSSDDFLDCNPQNVKNLENIVQNILPNNKNNTNESYSEEEDNDDENYNNKSEAVIEDESEDQSDDYGADINKELNEIDNEEEEEEVTEYETDADQNDSNENESENEIDDAEESYDNESSDSKGCENENKIINPRNTDSVEKESDDKSDSINSDIRSINESNFNADDEKEEKYYYTKENNEEGKNNDNCMNESNNAYESYNDEVINKSDIEKENENKKKIEDENMIDESNEIADESSVDDEYESNNNNELIEKTKKEDNISIKNENSIKNYNPEIKNENDVKNVKPKNKKDTILKNDDDTQESTTIPISEPPAKSASDQPQPPRHRHRSHHKNKLAKNDIKNEKNDNDNEKDIVNNDDNEKNKLQKSDDFPSKTTKHTSNKIKDTTNQEEVKDVPSNHTIDEIADISINNGDFSLINQSNMEKVMSVIRKKQREALEEGDYDLASKTQIATQSAIRYYNEKQLLKHSTNRACEINIKLQATRNDIDFLREHWMRVLENAKQKANDDLRQLKNEQDEELKNFDDNYNKVMDDPINNLPLEYRKSSSTVLELRKRQSVYVRSNDFQAAKALKKEITQLEDKERNANFLKFQKKLISERNQLIAKQDQKFEVRKENWIRTIEGIKSVANYEIDHARRCERQLENKFVETNEFSNNIIRQQQTSSLQQKNVQQSVISHSTSRPNVNSQFVNRKFTPKAEVEEFRQRAMINKIIYSNRIVPKVKKPVPTPRKGRRQYNQTPR